MADLELCFYSKCLKPSGRLTLETHASYSSPDNRNKRRLAAGRIPAQANGPAMDNNGICWIKGEEGRARG